MPSEDFGFLIDGDVPQSFVAGLNVECEVDADDFMDKVKGITDECARTRVAAALKKEKAHLVGAAKSVSTVKSVFSKSTKGGGKGQSK